MYTTPAAAATTTSLSSAASLPQLHQPGEATDSVLQSLNNGNNPTGTLTTASILTAAQTGTTSATNEPDIDSLKSTPNGELVLTTEGDGPGCCDPAESSRSSRIRGPRTRL